MNTTADTRWRMAWPYAAPHRLAFADWRPG